MSYCASCGLTGMHATDCLDWQINTAVMGVPVIPGPDVPKAYPWPMIESTTVDGGYVVVPEWPFEEPQEAVEAPTGAGAPMVWPMTAIVLGIVLMAIGFLWRDPVAVTLWEVVR